MVNLRNADQYSRTEILKNISESGRYVASLRPHWGNPYALCVNIASIYFEQTGLVPPKTIAGLLRWTTSAAIYGLGNAPAITSLSKFVHKQRRANAAVSLREALNRFGLKPAYETSQLEAKIDKNFFNDKPSNNDFLKFLSEDADLCPDFKSITGGSIIPTVTWYWDEHLEEIIKNLDLDIGVILFDERRHGFPEGLNISNNNLNLNIHMLDFESTDIFLREVSLRFGLDKLPEVRQDILFGSANKQISEYRGGRYYTEIGIASAIRAFERAAEKQPSLEEMASQPAPLDAFVDGEVLRLSGSGPPETNAPLDHLEQLRMQHADDVRRLLTSLQGANCGSGFIYRLESVHVKLLQNISHAGSLLLATQVRAIEDMLPAVSEVLTDLTAADVGATVSGLGLFVRQFPAWRKFLLEAERENAVPSDVLDNLLRVTESLTQQEDSVVERELKNGLTSVQDAAKSVDDPVLTFALLRGTSNVFRAIGRWLHERAKSISGEMTRELDGGIAKILVKAALGSLIAAVSGELLQLAAGYPHEFGWLTGLIIFIRTKKE